jgi:hemerythrin-like domain-containing protein
MSLKEHMHDARHAGVNALTPMDERETDILDTLKKEHGEIKELLANLQDAESSAQRQGLVRQLTAALLPHSVAEEKVVYETVYGLSDPQAQMDGLGGVLEHTLAAKALGRMADIADATCSEHRAIAKVLKELVEHHIHEEEHNIWRDVRKYCSHDDRARMNIQYLADKRGTTVPSAG